MEAVRLIKDPGSGRVVGARLRDKQAGLGTGMGRGGRCGCGCLRKWASPTRPTRTAVPTWSMAAAHSPHPHCCPRRRRRPPPPTDASTQTPPPPHRLRAQGGGRDFDVYARVVLNTTGPFVDGVRQLADPKAAPIVQPSSGAHVTLPEWYGGSSVGMIIPKTKVCAGVRRGAGGGGGAGRAGM